MLVYQRVSQVWPGFFLDFDVFFPMLTSKDSVSLWDMAVEVAGRSKQPTDGHPGFGIDLGW